MARKPAFIRHSREREARIQSRLLRVIEGKFTRKLARVIEAESRDLLSKYRELGYVPAASDADFAAFRDVYTDLGMVTARTFGSRVIVQGKSLGLILETKFSFAEFFRSVALNWVNQEAIRRRITSVTETTRARIISEVAKGQSDGLGVFEIAKGINKRVPKISRMRGALIARTETHGAANSAMHETAKQTGLELIKEWVSVEDMRTRRFSEGDEFDHAEMNEQKRRMDEPFDMPRRNGGPSVKIMYPGESGLPGSATINCRCAVVHIVADPEL